jgi:hypothetical protein
MSCSTIFLEKLLLLDPECRFVNCPMLSRSAPCVLGCFWLMCSNLYGASSAWFQFIWLWHAHLGSVSMYSVFLRVSVYKQLSCLEVVIIGKMVYINWLYLFCSILW